MFLYLPIETELDSPYLGRYHSCGLRVLRAVDGWAEEIKLLPDISTDFSFVLHLAELFTHQSLDPIHLLDVIEDSL